MWWVLHEWSTLDGFTESYTKIRLQAAALWLMRNGFTWNFWGYSNFPEWPAFMFIKRKKEIQAAIRELSPPVRRKIGGQSGLPDWEQLRAQGRIPS
jgi:hypothetical protein